jgi:hypothetical protein
MQRSALIVIENPPDRRAILEHDLLEASLPGSFCQAWRLTGDSRGLPWLTRGGLRLCLVGLGGWGKVTVDSHLPFNRAQAPDRTAHLDLRAAVGFQHGLGHIAQEMIGTIPVRNAWKLRGNPLHKCVLFV